MSATQNTINQAKGLVESLLQLEENFTNLSKVNLDMQSSLKEADATLNELQGENTGLRKVNQDLTNRLEDEIRKNEKLRLGLSQFVNLMEQAQPVNEVSKGMHLKDMVGPGAEITEEKKGYTPNTATQPPFYGIRTEKGETIIYPPERCQTIHQLSHFYRITGMNVSPDRLLERPGIHLRGLSPKSKRRLSEHYHMKFPDEPKDPVLKSFAHPSPGNSATHGLPEEPGRIR